MNIHDQYIDIKQEITKVYISVSDLIQAPLSIRNVFINSIDYVLDNGELEFPENKLHAICTVINKTIQYINQNIPEEYNNQEGKKWVLRFDRALISLQFNGDEMNEQEKAEFAQCIDDYITDIGFIMQGAIGEEERLNLNAIQQYLQKHISQNEKKLSDEKDKIPPKNSKSTKPKTEAKFKHILKDVEKEKLIEYLFHNQYTQQAKELVDFLCGKTPEKQIIIATDRLTDMCYLLSALYKKELVKVHGGKGYIPLFICHVCLFDRKLANRQVELEARKYRRRNYDNTNPAKAIDNFVNSLTISKK